MKKNILSFVLFFFIIGETYAESLIYVTNTQSDTVSVINTTSNSIIDTVQVVDGPQVIEITPNGLFAYVTNFISGTVSVIDINTNLVITTIPVGINPKGIDITPDGAFVYVANRGSGTVSVINTTTNAVIETITIVGQLRAHEIDISSDGALVYVTTSSNNVTPGELAVIDTTTNTVVDNVTIGVFPVGVAVTPNGAFVYAVNNISNSVSVIDTNTNTVVNTVGLGAARPEGIAISPNGAFVYVTKTSLASVAVIDTQTIAVVATIPVGIGPIDVAFTSDGVFAYVTNQDFLSAVGTVSVIATSTNTVVNSITVEGGPRGIAITALPTAETVRIDIKPGSFPNSINLCSNGVVPIAILGSNILDVYNINTETLRFAEASVKMVGKKDPHTLCNYGDSNDDSFDDLICNYLTTDIAALDGDSTTATVNGELLDGTMFEGTDSVNIVKDTCN